MAMDKKPSKRSTSPATPASTNSHLTNNPSLVTKEMYSSPAIARKIRIPRSGLAAAAKASHVVMLTALTGRPTPLKYE